MLNTIKSIKEKPIDVKLKKSDTAIIIVMFVAGFIIGFGVAMSTP
jgi:hypothetical protein